VNPPPPACAVCGIACVTLYHDRRSGQKQCRQHRHLRACAECGIAGVTLYVGDNGRAVCQSCRVSDPVSDRDAARSADPDGDRAALRVETLPDRRSPLDYRPRPRPARVTLELRLDDQDLQALQAMRLGEPLYKAAQRVGLTNNGLKVHLGRAVIDAWLARAA